MQAPIPGLKWGEEYSQWEGRFELAAWNDFTYREEEETIGDRYDPANMTPERLGELEELTDRMQQGLDQMTALFSELGGMDRIMEQGFAAYQKAAVDHPDMPKVESLEAYRKMMHVDKLEAILSGEDVDFDDEDGDAEDEGEEYDEEIEVADDGLVGLHFINPNMDYEDFYANPTRRAPYAISAKLLDAWKYVCDNQQRLKSIILEALFAKYEIWRAESRKEAEEMDAMSGDSGRFSSTGLLDSEMPPLASPAELHRVFRLLNIYVMERNGLAYVGYEFNNTWDEHGTGVVLQGDRLVDIGFADDTFGGFEGS